MKTEFALKSLAFAAIALAVVACKDDNADTKHSDEAKFDGASSKLTSALTMFDYDGRAEGNITVHDQDITFFSEGLTIQIDGTIAGSGDAITFKAVSNIPDVVAEGEYSITEED